MYKLAKLRNTGDGGTAAAGRCSSTGLCRVVLGGVEASSPTPCRPILTADLLVAAAVR
jgi:hypothetical protein